MKRLIVSLAALALCASSAFAQAPVVCPYNYATPAAVTASTQLVAAVAGKSIRICKVTFNVVQGATPVSFSLVYGTGSACGTGTTQLTLAFTGVAGATQAYDQPVGSSIAWTVPAGSDVCLLLSGAPTGAGAQVFYGAY